MQVVVLTSPPQIYLKQLRNKKLGLPFCLFQIVESCTSQTTYSPTHKVTQLIEITQKKIIMFLYFAIEIVTQFLALFINVSIYYG